MKSLTLLLRPFLPPQRDLSFGSFSFWRWGGYVFVCAPCPQLEAMENLFTIPLQLWKQAHVLFQSVGGWRAVVAQPWVTHPATCQGVQPALTIVAFPVPAAPSWKQNANQRANFSAAFYSFTRSDRQIFQHHHELDGAVALTNDMTVVKLKSGSLKGTFGTIPSLGLHPHPSSWNQFTKGLWLKSSPDKMGRQTTLQQQVISSFSCGLIPACALRFDCCTCVTYNQSSGKIKHEKAFKIC